MFIDGKAIETSAVLQVAHLMALAARTAPKGKGVDLIETIIISGEDLEKLGKKMISYGEETSQPLYVRDGNCLLKSQCILIVGVKNIPMGLTDCGFCGFGTCKGCTEAGGMCAIKQVDLGIAIGSAVSVASNHKVDNRVLFSAGKVSIDTQLFGDKLIKNAYAIGLSASGKNPYFDRPPL